MALLPHAGTLLHTQAEDPSQPVWLAQSNAAFLLASLGFLPRSGSSAGSRAASCRTSCSATRANRHQQYPPSARVAKGKVTALVPEWTWQESGA